MRHLIFLTLISLFIADSSNAQDNIFRPNTRNLMAQQNQDVFVPIAKYIQLGDSEKLSAWFANNLELDILGNVSNCSKTQATQILIDFFTNYTPRTFTITHKSGKSPMKYAIGDLNAGGEKFKVTLFVKTQEGGNQIQQFRIAKED